MNELSPLATLEPAGEGFEFDAVDRLCVGVPARRFLHGGVAFAACVEALERATGLPAIQVSAQFLSFGQPGDRVRLEPELAAEGRTVRQARLSASIGGRPFVIAHGAFGWRESEVAYRPPPPDLARWEDSEPRSVVHLLSTRIEKLFEFRLAAGEVPASSAWKGSGGKRIAFWIRPRGGKPVGRLMLAMIADLAPVALHGALGRLASGTSLDNAIRYVERGETDTVLCAVTVEAVGGGFSHLTTRQFAPDGRLLAVATQSQILRLWDKL